MLSNCIIIILALIIPISAFLSFKAGYKTGRAVQTGAEIPEIVPRARDKPEPLTAEQERLNSILANIDSYDGTGEGQVRL